MNNMKKPKIRFKGFTDDWEQRKLGDIVEFLDTLRKPLTENTRTKGPYPYYGASGVVDHVADYLFNEELILLSEDGANITDRNYPVCFLASGKYWVNNHAHVLRAKPKMDNNFICMSLERKDYSNYNTGMAMPKLNQDTCRRIPVDCPSYEEQKKIGDYFRSLDNLITLHQRKYEKLQIIKKSMLENCFPKNGEKVPKIRFSGFTGDWEQCKLSEMVGMTYGGGTPSTANDTFWYGDIPWIQSSNVVEDELFNVDIKKHISRDGLNHSAAQLVPENSVAVVTHVGVGKLVFMPYSYTTSQDFISLGDMKCEPRFLCYALYKRLQEDLHIVQGSAIKGITKEDLMNKLISVPQITEQTKIANTLQGLDHLITLHQSELEKLQKIKKSLLERMFV